MKTKNRKLVLENGSIYEGYGLGATESKVFEIVFNTSMVGYQEILSDLSYAGQGVVMTYPLIGNYGLSKKAAQSDTIAVEGFIVRAHYKDDRELEEDLIKKNIAGITGVDTRKLTREIRQLGSMRAIIAPIDRDSKELMSMLLDTKLEENPVAKIGRTKIEKLAVDHAKYRVVIIDCGIKESIIQEFIKRQCELILMPWSSSTEEVLIYKPDGIFLSNGPGSPAVLSNLIDTVGQLKGQIPIFGICLGHQIIAHAYGAKTYHMKFGHHGANHAVKNLKDGSIAMTAQNHSYAVDEDSLKETDLVVTHRNLLDHSVEGFEDRENLIFSVQYHPEAAPGPKDSQSLFDDFIDLIERNRYDKR